METIPSFKVDHTKLRRGIYVSRSDLTPRGDVITTFDIRIKEPNVDYMPPKAAHTIEHIGATLLRNNAIWKDKVVYFGPMGCMTGFYLLLNGKFCTNDITDFIEGLFRDIANWDCAISGATAKECGNAKYHDLKEAKRIAMEYLNVLKHSKNE